jgi:hypothetical protein
MGKNACREKRRRTTVRLRAHLVAETGHSFSHPLCVADVLTGLVGLYSPVAPQKRVLLGKRMRAHKQSTSC